MNFQEILNQTVTYKGHTLKFIDFVHRFKTKKDVIDHDNGTYILSRRTKFYLDVLNKHKNLKFFWSWNWAAFFLSTVLWLFYRKLAKFAFCVCIFNSLPLSVYKITEKYLKTIDLNIRMEVFSWILFIIIIFNYFIFPSIANYLYFSKLADDINSNKLDSRNTLNPFIAFLLTVLFKVFSFAVPLLISGTNSVF